MANFPPLKNYLLFCLDQLAARFGLSAPFLDIGCGIADISEHFALKGWSGKAIDFSDEAVKEARDNLAAYKNIEVKKESLFQTSGKFNTVFCLDVLEHIEDDTAALNKISSLLSLDGYLVLAVPSNPKEWRWDDDFYGHYRRYSPEEIRKKLTETGFEPLFFSDFTYPAFWLMRRIYTRFKSPCVDEKTDKLMRTTASPMVNAWDIPVFSAFLSRNFIFWKILFRIQYKYFSAKVKNGHEMIVLAKKKG
jgi:SAM-dependent methyltransferase